MLKQATANTSPLKVGYLVVAWLGATVAVSASGVLHDPPRLVLPVLIWASFVAFLVGFALSPGLRERIRRIDLRRLIMFHFVLVPIGIAFIVMEAAGRLPSEFAVKAGIGDIVVGAAAIIAIMSVPLLSTIRSRTVLVWNTLGLADILMVFATAQSLIWSGKDPDLIGELTRFPLLIVPMFVVPMVLITHFAIFARLWSERSRRVISEA